MPAARLWCPLTRLARVWLNLCLEGCSLDVRGCPPLPPPPPRPLAALSSAVPTPVEAAAPRLVWALVASFPWHEGLLRACLLRCLGRLLSGRARHLTVPRTSPCTSCGCGRLICHAHIHSWCTKILDFAALVQNPERTVPRRRFPRVDLHNTVPTRLCRVDSEFVPPAKTLNRASTATHDRGAVFYIGSRGSGDRLGECQRKRVCATDGERTSEDPTKKRQLYSS